MQQLQFNATVTPGSATVTWVSGSNPSSLTAGAWFALASYPVGVRPYVMVIQSVTATSGGGYTLSLTAPWTGAAATNVPAVAQVDFTPAGEALLSQSDGAVVAMLNQNTVVRANNFALATALASYAPLSTLAGYVTNTALAALPSLTDGGCQLRYTSPTTLTLMPMDGATLYVNGTTWQVPSGGVSLSNGGLTAGQLYYVYAQVTNNALALLASQTPPVADAQGRQIQSGNAACRFVGMAFLNNAAGQFQDDTTLRGVASYFHRRTKTAAVAVAGQTFSSTSLVECTAARLLFLAWDDETITQCTVGNGSNSTAGGGIVITPYLDGAYTGDTLFKTTHASAGGICGLAVPHAGPITRGLHFIDPAVATFTGGTATVSFSNVITIRI